MRRAVLAALVLFGSPAIGRAADPAAASAAAPKATPAQPAPDGATAAIATVDDSATEPTARSAPAVGAAAPVEAPEGADPVPAARPPEAVATPVPALHLTPPTLLETTAAPPLTRFEVDRRVMRATGRVFLMDLGLLLVGGTVAAHSLLYGDGDGSQLAGTALLVVAATYPAFVHGVVIGGDDPELRSRVVVRSLVAGFVTAGATALLREASRTHDELGPAAVVVFLVGRYFVTPGVAAGPVYDTVPRANRFQHARPERDPANLTR